MVREKQFCDILKDEVGC